MGLLRKSVRSTSSKLSRLKGHSCVSFPPGRPFLSEVKLMAYRFPASLCPYQNFSCGSHRFVTVVKGARFDINAPTLACFSVHDLGKMMAHDKTSSH
jgi:hypothetical protein